MAKKTMKTDTVQRKRIMLLMALLGVANHFTMKYHGALLTVEDIQNLKTVSGVIGAYDLSVDAIAGRILLLAAAVSSPSATRPSTTVKNWKSWSWAMA